MCSLLLGCCCSQPSQLLNCLYFERLFIYQHVASKLSSVWGFSFDFICGYFAYEKIIAHIVTWFIFSFLFSCLLGFMSNSGVLHFSIITFLPIFFFPSTFIEKVCLKILKWRRKWQPTPVFLPGESHGQRSLAGRKGQTQLTAKPPPTCW